MLFVFDRMKFDLLKTAGFPRFSGLRAARVPAMGFGIRFGLETGIATRMVKKGGKSGALPGTYGAGRAKSKNGARPGTPNPPNST